MLIPKRLYKINAIRQYLAKRHLEAGCAAYIGRIDNIENSFIRKLYAQIVSCSKEDVIEFYIESALNKIGNPLMWSAEFLAFVDELYKRTVFYDVITFLEEAEEENQSEEIKECFCRIFTADSGDWEEYNYFCQLVMENRQRFQMEYFRKFCGKVMGIENITPSILAFITNFFYNSYDGFIKSFTYYVPLNSKSMRSGRDKVLG